MSRKDTKFSFMEMDLRKKTPCDQSETLQRDFHHNFTNFYKNLCKRKNPSPQPFSLKNTEPSQCGGSTFPHRLQGDLRLELRRVLAAAGFLRFVLLFLILCKGNHIRLWFEFLVAL